MKAPYNPFPPLRFKGFSGDLTTITLLNVCNGEISNGVFNDPGRRDGNYRLVNVLDMFGTDRIEVSSLSSLTLERKEFEKNKVKYGDIFFTRSSLVPAGIAWSNVYLSHDENITFDGHLMKISPDLCFFSPEYLAQYFRSRPIRKQLIVRGKTGTMTTIGQADIASVELTVPTLREQQKIAAFLTAVDGRIGQLSEKKALLEAYKKGVMKQLFSRELRFRDDDGNAFPEWEEKRLGEVSKFINGRAYKQNELLSEGPYPVLRVGNFFTNPEWYYSDLELPADKYCDTGDLLYAWSASFGPRIWRGGKVIFHYHIWKVIPSEKITKPFLFHLLDWDVERIKNAQGNGIAMMHVTKQAIEERPVSLPCVQEQTKIAAFLTALDRKIEAVSTQIDLTRTFKKGLLQQMFV